MRFPVLYWLIDLAKKGLFRYICFLFLIICISTCKEIYYPILDESISLLVVQGLVTDEPNEYTIKLTRSIPFNKGLIVYEQGAKVYLESSEGNTYNFQETIPGYYVSDESKFKTKYGTAYTLIIQTKDRKAYRSSAQILYPKGSLDSIHSVITTKTITNYENGLGERIRNERGVDFFGTIDMKNDSVPYYRFSNTLMPEYTKKFIIYSNDTIKIQYCWLKYTPYDYLNLSEREHNLQMVKHLLGFCPLDTIFYGIQFTPLLKAGVVYGYIKMESQLYMITFKQYHLNKDVYNYYSQVNLQLAASQSILDPVNIQVTGNIICTTNPQETVLGVFEVSSISKYSF